MGFREDVLAAIRLIEATGQPPREAQALCLRRISALPTIILRRKPCEEPGLIQT